MGNANSSGTMTGSIQIPTSLGLSTMERRPYSYFRLSVITEITPFELVMIDSRMLAVAKKHTYIFTTKCLGALCPQDQVFIKIEAQYES